MKYCRDFLKNRQKFNRLNVLSIRWVPSTFISKMSVETTYSMGLLPNMQNRGLLMRRECWERFPRHRFQRKPLVSEPGMHHGTCVAHVPWCMPGSLNRSGGGKRSRYSRHMRNPWFCVIGRRPMEKWYQQCTKLNWAEYSHSILASLKFGHISVKPHTLSKMRLDISKCHWQEDVSSHNVKASLWQVRNISAKLKINKQINKNVHQINTTTHCLTKKMYAIIFEVQLLAINMYFDIDISPKPLTFIDLKLISNSFLARRESFQHRSCSYNLLQ